MGVEVPAEAIGLIVAKLLATAKRATEEAGKKLHDKPDQLAGVMAVLPSTTGIALGPKPGYVSLVLHMGAARLAIPFRYEAARELGQALVAASASPDRPQ
jgi:hypothetical protein